MNINELANKFNGITIVGDIHGNINDFQKAVNHAVQKRNFFISLGDLIDYGHQNYECIKLMYSLIKSKTGLMIIGNHDDKMKRWIVQRREGNIRIQIKGGIVPSIDEWNKLSPKEQDDFDNTFMKIYNSSTHHLVLNNVILTHGAAHNEMWIAKDLNKKHRARALYGQIDRTSPKREDGYPNRIYKWVDDLKMHDNNSPQIAIVGHDVRSEKEPLRHDSNKGGFAVFLDTGSSKGGKLSLVDLIFNSDGTLKPEGYKTFSE